MVIPEAENRINMLIWEYLFICESIIAYGSHYAVAIFNLKTNEVSSIKSCIGYFYFSVRKYLTFVGLESIEIKVICKVTASLFHYRKNLAIKFKFFCSHSYNGLNTLSIIIYLHLFVCKWIIEKTGHFHINFSMIDLPGD